jgi:hypothetical protein
MRSQGIGAVGEKVKQLTGDEYAIAILPPIVVFAVEETVKAIAIISVRIIHCPEPLFILSLLLSAM